MARIEFVGHATVLIELNGMRVLTDPLLRKRVTHLRRAVPVDDGALQDIDAVLISHLHYDHLDKPSLRRIGKDTPVVMPRGSGRLLRKKGFGYVTEIGVEEEISIGSLRLRTTPAVHDRKRLPVGAKAEPVGYVLAGEQTVYFAGDTDLFEGMAAIGPVDVGLIPIAGWGPGLGPGHMDAATAAESLPLVKPRIAIPIHWGTYYPIHLGFRGRPRFVDLPPALFAKRAAEVAPEVEVRVLRPGEATTV